jgi:nicotinamide-nucleotide amidase
VPEDPEPEPSVEYWNHTLDDLPGFVGSILEKLVTNGLMVAFAESCSGGLVSDLITNLPGSSDVFWGGVVSYSNEAKMMMLDVPPTILADHGAVSAETAGAMAVGLLKRSGVGIAVSVTGIAGPSGGTPDKPVGLVYFGIASKIGVRTHKENFDGPRLRVKEKTAFTAYKLLNEEIDALLKLR